MSREIGVSSFFQSGKKELTPLIRPELPFGAFLRDKWRGLRQLVGAMRACGRGGLWVLLDLVQVLAGRCRVVSRDASAAEAFGRQADGARDRLDGKVTETVGSELLGHALLRRGR